MNAKLSLIVPMSMTDDYPFDFNLCIFGLGTDFFEEVGLFSELVADNGLESVTKFVNPPGFYSDPEEEGSELEKIDFQVDRVTLNITARSIYWSGIVYGKYRDIPWKTHAVPLEDLSRAQHSKEPLDYRT